MKAFLKPIVLIAALLLMAVAAFLPERPLRLGFVGNAEAIIGMPWTHLSFAGVARRSMYRQAVWNAAAVNAAAANAAAAQAAAAAAAQRAAAALPIGTTVPYLPPNCTSTVITGVNYFNCGGVYYRAGFQGKASSISCQCAEARRPVPTPTPLHALARCGRWPLDVKLFHTEAESRMFPFPDPIFMLRVSLRRFVIRCDGELMKGKKV
jgi:hypothetical protein